MIRRLLAVGVVGFLNLCGATATFALEPDQLRVLDANRDGPQQQIVRKFLISELKSHFAARRAAMKAIASEEDFEARRTQVRENLFRINGPFPERTPLEAKTVATLQRDGYVIENVIYQSRPGVYATANLYLPKGASKENRVPAVLIPCGHSANGKANDVYQSAAISLALNGMAALIYDPIGQGERYQLLGTNEKPLVGSTTEHTLVGVGAWLAGTGCANYRIWDGIRSLDYLASRPEVDPEKLGCTGNSGGGTLTAYLMAFDERILAAAPSCYITTLERLFDTIGPQDAEQNFPGQSALGIDHADYVELRAPKPTLICVATQDFFDIDGAWTTFREAKNLYGLLGHAERMDFFEFNDKHGFSKPRRQAAMRFMRRWLLNKDDNPDEPKHTLSKDAELQCTKSGQVLVDFRNAKSMFQVSRERAEALASQRQELWKDRKAALAKVRRVAGMPELAEVARVGDASNEVKADSRGTTTIGESAKEGWTGAVERLVLTRNDGVALPALLFTPKPDGGTTKRPGVVYASSDGKEADAGPDGPIAKLVAAGNVVLAIDLRGYGETSPVSEANRNKDPWFGSDIQLPLLAIHLNRPLVGQRAEDILAAVAWLTKWEGVASERIEVTGVKHAGPAALHAALFDTRISAVTLKGSIGSWMDVVTEPACKNQLQNVVPFALESYDLPELVKAIAPRKVSIVDPVDAQGNPLTSQ